MRLQIRTLSEIKGEQSLSIVGEIWAPLVELAEDKAISSAMQKKGGNVAKAIRIATEKHASSIYDMLAALTVDADTGERVTTKDYIENCNAIMVMNQLTKVLSDPAVSGIFLSQSPETDESASGSATENTAESEK